MEIHDNVQPSAEISQCFHTFHSLSFACLFRFSQFSHCTLPYVNTCSQLCFVKRRFFVYIFMHSKEGVCNSRNTRQFTNHRHHHHHHHCHHRHEHHSRHYHYHGCAICNKCYAHHRQMRERTPPHLSLYQCAARISFIHIE